MSNKKTDKELLNCELDAAEIAIELAKKERGSTWNEIAKKGRKMVSKWGKKTDDDDDDDEFTRDDFIFPPTYVSSISTGLPPSPPNGSFSSSNCWRINWHMRHVVL